MQVRVIEIDLPNSSKRVVNQCRLFLIEMSLSDKTSFVVRLICFRVFDGALLYLLLDLSCVRLVLKYGFAQI